MTLQQAAELFENLANLVLKQGGFSEFNSALLTKQAVDVVKNEALKQATEQQTNHVEEKVK